MFENYGLIIYWHTGEECFIAESSEMMLCRGVGNTRQQALDALEQDIENWRNTQRTLELPGFRSEQQEIEQLPVKEPEQTTTISQPKTVLQREEIVTDIMVEGTIRLGIRINAEKPIIYLSGEIDLNTVFNLEKPIDDLIASGTPTIIIDLTAVSYIDSSGFGILLSAFKKLRHDHSTNGKLILTGANPAIDRMLLITKMNTIFTVRKTIQDAEELLAATT